MFRCSPSRSRNALGVTSMRAPAMPLPPYRTCWTGTSFICAGFSIPHVMSVLCAGILPSFAEHHNRIIIFVPEARPDVVSPAWNGLRWSGGHVATVHTPIALPRPVGSPACLKLSAVRPGLPGLDRPGPPPDCHPGETMEDGVRPGMAGGPRVFRRDPVLGDQRDAPVREDPLPSQLPCHAALGRLLCPVRRAIRRNPGHAPGPSRHAPALDRRGPVGHAGMAARPPLFRFPLGAARL